MSTRRITRDLTRSITRKVTQEDGDGYGPELIPGTSSTLMRRADWSISGEDGTHIVTDVAGGIRFQSDTTTPQMSMIALGILDIGSEYRLEVSGLVNTSGFTKSDAAVGILNPLPSGVTDFTAVGTAFNITRGSTNVDTEIGAVSIRKKV